MSEYQNLRSTEAGYTMEEELGDRTCKDRVRNLLENPNSGLGAQAIHYFLMLVILVSTLCVIIETVPSVSGSPVFLPAEMCFTALFTAEFALRLYASESFTEFIANPFNIVDFLAVFPGYMSLLGVMLRQDDQKNSFAHLGKATKSMRSLRMVRIVRLVRVFRVMRICKVARHSEVLFLTFMVFLKVSQSGLFLVLMLIGFAMEAPYDCTDLIGNSMPPDGDAEEAETGDVSSVDRAEQTEVTGIVDDIDIV
ncbi:Potassium voltage-gated channel subfamily B member 2 (Voltage-gated potassium channel subunit Kv2.2) [Durusdinium trenchii]|uniref:Potassium voltage-gated channel subfamily B member 2 (Voltage-gated potassium channel subunit Kv2.2) n=1 Tax=Durusdinium trenchii TaxID=1381693 RepID=A0ABP0N609_9DINO